MTSTEPSAPSSEPTKVFKEGEPTLRLHIWLYAEDVRWIDEHMTAIKRSKFIRKALRKVIRAIQAQAEHQGQALHTTDVEG